MAKPAGAILLLLSLTCSALTLSSAANLNYTFGSTMVSFLGQSPNFQIYPNVSSGSYLQLRFSKFEEHDSSDSKVQGHSVESLASASPTWTAGTTVLDDGTNCTYVRMVLQPADRNGFSVSCPTNSGRRMLAAPSTTTSNATVTVTLYFGFNQSANFTYGFNKSLTVAKGGLKFNVEYSNWPFCDAANTLSMQIDLLLKGDTTANVTTSTASDNTTKVLTIPIGDNTTSSIYFAATAYEAKNGNRSMNVGVALDTSGGKSTVVLKLPNPTPNSTVYYDPTVTSNTQSGSTSVGSSNGASDPIELKSGQSRVRFLGKSPNFQVYANASSSSYIQLRFSKFEERDTSNQKVQGHSVESLASAEPSWATDNITLTDGTVCSYVTMTLNPASRNGFQMSCPGSSITPTVAASVSVTLYFGCTANATFPYGFNKSVTVAKGGLKFNVAYSNWPFCAVNNTLNMQIDLLVAGNATATATSSTASDGVTKILKVPIGDNTTSDIYFAPTAYEAVNGNRSMNVGVALDTSGGKSTISLTLPNPTPNTSLYYDPTVVMTLDSDTGAAGAVRVTLWSVLAALLLSAFVRY